MIELGRRFDYFEDYRLLEHDVHDFIENGANPQALHSLLQRCLDDGGIKAMNLVGLLFENDYGGETWKWELKEPAGFALLFWGESGLDEIVRLAAGNGRFSNLSIVFDILSSAAAGDFSSFLLSDTSIELRKRLVSSGCFTDEMRKQAIKALIEIVLHIEEEEDVLNPLASVFQRHCPIRREQDNRV